MSSRPPAQLTYAALIGQILQFHRQRKRLHQAEIAAALGVLQPAYSRIEKGDTSITVAQLRIVARRLGMHPARIVDEAEEWARQLRRQGVIVTDDRAVPKTALVVGLGILAAAMLAAGTS
jgi:transcriptional regulator with XRE-family HTH domain